METELNQTGLKVGDVVKFTTPESDAEAAQRFDLIEHNGDRVLIRWRCDWTIAPTQVVRTTDVVVA